MNESSDRKEIMNKYSVSDVESMGEADKEERLLLKEMLVEAESYLGRFKWCRKIERSYFGCGVGSVFAVFLMEIENASSPSDDLLWVIIGDIPSAYLVANDGPQNPQDALQEYINLMSEWVIAAEGGKDVDELIPVNVSPTKENAQQLRSRLHYLQSEFL